MKIFLIILLNFTLILANESESKVVGINQITKIDKKIRGCKSDVFEKKEKKSCDKKVVKKISITPIIIPNEKEKRIIKLEMLLKSMKNEFEEYKQYKDKETKEMFSRLNDVTKEFEKYKNNKEKKIKKIKTELRNSQKQLSKNRKKLASIQKSIKKKRVIKKSKRSKKQIIPKKESEPMPSVANFPWVEIVVEDGLSIYQLAQKYYKNRKDYKLIYVANKNIIGKDFKIRDGMSLKIPMTENFEEQPMFLNHY